MGDAAHKKHAAAKIEAKHAAKVKPAPTKPHTKHASAASHGKSSVSAKKTRARK
jgi:hypothetical protein